MVAWDNSDYFWNCSRHLKLKMENSRNYLKSLLNKSMKIQVSMKYFSITSFQVNIVKSRGWDVLVVCLLHYCKYECCAFIPEAVGLNPPAANLAK